MDWSVVKFGKHISVVFILGDEVGVVHLPHAVIPAHENRLVVGHGFRLLRFAILLDKVHLHVKAQRCCIVFPKITAVPDGTVRYFDLKLRRIIVVFLVRITGNPADNLISIFVGDETHDAGVLFVNRLQVLFIVSVHQHGQFFTVGLPFAGPVTNGIPCEKGFGVPRIYNGGTAPLSVFIRIDISNDGVFLCDRTLLDCTGAVNVQGGRDCLTVHRNSAGSR